jgi:stage II sporulation protein D
LRLLLSAIALLLLAVSGGADPQPDTVAKNKNIGAPSSGFPRTVRVRLWYLHPPASLKLHADAGQARMRKCETCADGALGDVTLRASASKIEVSGEKSAVSHLRMDGAFQMNPPGEAAIRAEFPVEVRALQGQLLVTATMPMDEYLAGVLAGEVGSFKSDEALKALAVAARTYAMHFGSRHALEGFDLCGTTHCQDLRIAGSNPRLRQIAESTASEVLWYEGEPAATYYHANCGGTTEDGKFILGNDEAKAPYLKQHSDTYCTRNGGAQWSSEVSKAALQRALAADGIRVPGTLRAVAVAQRTPSGRAEVVRVTGAGSVMVPGLAFRFAVGRHIGWEKLKSNWYDVSVAGDRIVFHGRGSGHGVGLCQVGAEVMGEEGKSYREILAFYYPGTRLQVSSAGAVWQALVGENVEMLTTRPEVDRAFLPVASQSVGHAEQATGLKFRKAPRWKVFPTVAMFRDTTGEPGWVAAATRGRVIQTQPAETLQRAGTLESTLRHEFLHMLIESYAKPGVPVWFREGLVLYLSEPNGAAQAQPPSGKNFATTAELESAMRNPANEQQLREAYKEARARVVQLAKQNGRAVLMDWVQHGLPPAVTSKP